jgi:hypothetical protein
MADLRLMIRVLQQREGDARRVLARLTRDVQTNQAALAATERAIASVDQLMKIALSLRYTTSTRTVAALLESDEYTRTLRTTADRLRQLRTQAQRVLDESIARQQAAARHWRRDEARLEHIQTLAHRERVAQAVRVSEAEDEAHAERRLAVGAAR